MLSANFSQSGLTRIGIVQNVSGAAEAAHDLAGVEEQSIPHPLLGDAVAVAAADQIVAVAGGQACGNGGIVGGGDFPAAQLQLGELPVQGHIAGLGCHPGEKELVPVIVAEDDCVLLDSCPALQYN